MVWPEVRVMDYRNLGKRVLSRPRDKSWQDFLSELVRERIEPSFLAVVCRGIWNRCLTVIGTGKQWEMLGI